MSREHIFEKGYTKPPMLWFAFGDAIILTAEITFNAAGTCYVYANDNGLWI